MVFLKGEQFGSLVHLKSGLIKWMAIGGRGSTRQGLLLSFVFPSCQMREQNPSFLLHKNNLHHTKNIWLISCNERCINCSRSSMNAV